MAGKYCMNCGTFLPESANYCYKCGVQQNTPVKDNANQKEQEKTIPETPVNDFKFEKTGDNTVEIKEYDGHNKCVNIPERILISNTKTGESKIYNIESIGNYAFMFNHELTEIYVPNSVKKINQGAFNGCDTLKFIKLPEDLQILGKICFSSCESLESITLPKKLEVVEDRVFENCKKLNKITIPLSVKKIGQEAFEFCENLEIVELPENLEEIGKEAFHYCKKLKEIKIPNKVKIIGQEAFGSCENLEIVELPENLEEIGNKAFQYCENLKEIKIPNKVKIIGDGLFNSCKHLQNVYLPESITSIGKTAFSFCERLASISVPTNVKEINSEAFSFCDKLRKVVIGKNTIKIADDAFDGCDSKLAIQAPSGSYAESFGKIHDIQVREIVSLGEIKNIDNIEPNSYSVSYPNLGKSKDELFHPAKTLIAPDPGPWGLWMYGGELPAYHEDEFEIVYTFFANEITGVNSNGESRQFIIRQFCSAADDDDDSYEMGDEISFDLKIDNTFSFTSQRIKIILPDINKQIGVLPNSLSKLVKPLLDKKYLYHLYGKFEKSTKGYYCDMRLVFNNMKYPTEPFSDDYSYYLPVEYFPQHMQKDIKRRMNK